MQSNNTIQQLLIVSKECYLNLLCMDAVQGVMWNTKRGKKIPFTRTQVETKNCENAAGANDGLYVVQLKTLCKFHGNMYLTKIM